MARIKYATEEEMLETLKAIIPNLSNEDLYSMFCEDYAAGCSEEMQAGWKSVAFSELKAELLGSEILRRLNKED